MKFELESIDTFIQANGGPFIFGKVPSAADAAAFGILDQIIYAGQLTPQLQAVTDELPRLKTFVDNIREQFFRESYIKEVAWVGPAPTRLEENKSKND